MEEKKIEVTADVETDGAALGDQRPRSRIARTSGAAKTRLARPRSELDLLADISAKLDRVIAVLAAQGKDRDSQAEILGAAGCDSTFVSRIVGISPGAVRNLPGWRRSHGDGDSDAEDSR